MRTRTRSAETSAQQNNVLVGKQSIWGNPSVGCGFYSFDSFGLLRLIFGLLFREEATERTPEEPNNGRHEQLEGPECFRGRPSDPLLRPSALTRTPMPSQPLPFVSLWSLAPPRRSQRPEARGSAEKTQMTPLESTQNRFKIDTEWTSNQSRIDTESIQNRHRIYPE